MPNKRIIILISLFITCSSFAQQIQRYQLGSIAFEGNHSFSSSVLGDVIYSKETPWWFWRFLHSFSSLGKEPVYFDSTDIQYDLNALREYYKSNGFFRAEFSYNYSIDTADKFVDLNYIINENNPSNYGKLTLYGLQKVPEPLYSRIIEDTFLDTSKRFSQKTIENNNSTVINYLQNNGYMFARLDSSIVIMDTTDLRADINIYFTAGNRYKVDTVLVNKTGDGAHLVTESLLRDITGIRAGEYYNQEELRRSQVRLYRTGLFNTVLLSGVEKDTTDSKIPIKLDGTFGLMNELSPEFILNNQQSLFNIGLGLSYIRKNFLGDARKLTIGSSFGVQNIFNADIGNLIKKFSFRDTTLLGYVDSRITIDQPYVFEKPIFATWETYATINKQQDYNNTVYGSKLTFQFEMPTYTFLNNLSSSYTLEQSNEVYRTYNDSISTKLISDIAADASSTTADNILFPTRGYNLSFHIEEANSIPYLVAKLAKIKYTGALFYKLVLNSAYYVSLDRLRTSIAAFKFKIGDLQTFYGNFSGVPINRTFYAGGSNSVRGWRANQLVPEGSQTVLDLQGESVMGGSFLVEGSMEFRQRFLENFGFAIFTDYGNTFLGYRRFRFDRVAVGAGMGFRYYTQIAPFRVDFGFKVYDPADKTFILNQHVWKRMEIHFGIGEAF